MATEKSFPKCHLGYSILGSCIQSKLIVIDECEQRRPAQALPNQTQLTLSGRRVFRRYSFLGTPPPPILDLPLSNRQPQHESLSEENIIIPFLPCWSSYHKLCWLMSVNFELVKTASVKYCLSKCDKLVIWWITYMELSILQTFEEAVFRTYKMKDLERSVWLRSFIHRRCFRSRCK